LENWEIEDAALGVCWVCVSYALVLARIFDGENPGHGGFCAVERSGLAKRQHVRAPGSGSGSGLGSGVEYFFLDMYGEHGVGC